VRTSATRISSSPSQHTIACARMGCPVRWYTSRSSSVCFCVMALEPRCLQKTFREVPSDTPEAELAELLRRFPTVIRSVDGTQLGLSQLPPSDSRVATDYGVAYGYWLEGDPFEALQAVRVPWRSQDWELVVSTLLSIDLPSGASLELEADRRPR